jgi:hypothetical protein
MANHEHMCKIRECERALANESPSFPLSHHPNCARFKSHTFNLGQFRFCIGCYIGYPSAITGIVGYLAFLASLGKFSEMKIVKILQKISIGMGSGFILVFGFFLFDVFVVIKILVVILILVGLIIPIRAVHLRKALNICTSCERKGKDPYCSPED